MCCTASNIDKLYLRVFDADDDEDDDADAAEVWYGALTSDRPAKKKN